MNDELISRKAVIDFICTFIDYNDDGEQVLEANPDIVILGLKGLPSTIAEIIWCKDCEFWDEGSCYCEDIDVSGLEYYVGDIHTEENDFCSHAERRTDGRDDL